jgi:copper transport protein
MKKFTDLLAASFIALAWLLLGVQPALAHATLVRSNPAAGAIVDSAPPSIELEFSEQLDPGFSRVQLINSRDQMIEPGPGNVSPANSQILSLIIPDLPKGSYIALWRVRSAADGHITEGNIPFGVGEEPSAGSLIPAPDAPDPATLPPPPLDTFARWLNFLAAAAALGGIPFALLVWRPAFRRAARSDQPTATTSRLGDQETGRQGDSYEEPLPVSSSPRRAESPWSQADEAMTHFLRRVLGIGGLAFLLTNLFFLITQAASAAEVPLLGALGAPLLTLLSGRAGVIVRARFALTLQIIVLSWRLPPAGGGSARLWWGTFVIADVILLSMSLNSHAAATQDQLAIPLDWLHLAAMVAWIGGLVPLAAAVSAARRDPAGALPLRLLIARFTRLALACVLVLALTGLYSYELHVERLELLTATTYGRALLVKLGLFAALVLLGFVNMWLLGRRLGAGGGGSTGALWRSVRAELVLGALVLLLAGALTSVAPSLAAWEAHEQQGIAQSATVGDVDLTLRIAPAQIGDNEFAVDVSDRRPGAAAAATRVLLRFDMQGMEMGKLQAETKPTGGERYTARGSFTSMGGRWNIEVVLRRAGFDDVRHVFQVDILRGEPFVIAP